MNRIFIRLFIMLFVLSLGWAEIEKYTNKDFIALRGKADANVNIDIYVNGEIVSTARTDGEGMWSAENITLKNVGMNKVYAMARSDDGYKSKTSTALNVIVDQEPPQIINVQVAPKRVKVGDRVKVSVRASKDTKTVSAVFPDSSTDELIRNGERWEKNWDVPELGEGAYKVLVVATDRAGNTAQDDSQEIILGAGAPVPVAVTVAPVALPTTISLQITSPLDGAVVYEDMLAVKGIAPGARQVLVNGTPVFVNPDMLFVASVPMKPGKNIITAQADLYSGQRGETSVKVLKLLTFNDIQMHWARREIEYLATLGYVQAYPNTTIFAPDQPISRAELAALLVRAKQLPLDFGIHASTFRDMRANYWAVGYVETAVKYGLVEGYPGATYRPQNMVTRAEAAAMFVRFSSIPLMKIERTTDLDVPFSHWASGYIAAFKAAGLMPNTWQQGNRFYPEQAITRAELCAIMARISYINREIETLIERRTNFDYAVDNSYFVRSAQSYSSPQPAPNDERDASAIIVGLTMPREVLVGNALNLSVASLVKLKQIYAVFPDKQTIHLKVNPVTQLWETNWRVPPELPVGIYQAQIVAISESGERYNAQSNQFSIYNRVGAKVLPADEPEAAIQDLTPEPNKAVTKPTQNKTALTRAQMTAVLAKYKKLRKAKLSAAPARDVSVGHPQAATIKSGIVTGIVPNVTPGVFAPNKTVTYVEAVTVLRKAGVVVQGFSVKNKQQVTVQEFDNWLKKSVE